MMPCFEKDYFFLNVTEIVSCDFIFRCRGRVCSGHGPQVGADINFSRAMT